MGTGIDSFASGLSEAEGVFHRDGSPRPRYRALWQCLARFKTSGLNVRQQRLDRAGVELGIHFSAYDQLEGDSDPPFSKLELCPHILSAEDWSTISAGVLQRARAFNAYIHDIYHDQRILLDRALPFPLVLGDPAFQRAFTHITAASGSPCLCGAFDLLPTAAGTWKVIENHMATPSGLALILQNRRSLAQAFPEIFDTNDVTPVAPFAIRLAEALREPSAALSPSIVVLTRGGTRRRYFEESFLARQFGVPLVRPGDLLVRDGRVHLKTIRGLQRVDVIYRCIRGESLDPIAQAHFHADGIPGLINIARQGNVIIVNAPGAGIADNRALLRYSDRIISYYLNESPVLSTVPTYDLGDPDQAAFAFDHPEDFVFKPIHDPATLPESYGGQAPAKTSAARLRRMRGCPHLFAAQTRQTVARLPVFEHRRFEQQPFMLRVFFLLGRQPQVLPGGLSLHYDQQADPQRSALHAKYMKDTWTTRPPANVQPARPDADAAIRVNGGYSISSRIAESLYWGGRYLERAENTSRQLNILENVRWDQMDMAGRQTYWPLWKAVAAATGKRGKGFDKRPPRDTLKLSNTLVIDPAEAASVVACVRSARLGLEGIRESLSPETWQVLIHLDLFLEGHLTHKRLARLRLCMICQKVVDELARLNGTAERTLTHDDGWRFFRIGALFERALATLTIVSAVLAHAADIRQNTADASEETDLTALLRLLCSLDAYHKTYRSRARWDRVAHLLLRDCANPSSVSHCLRFVDHTLGELDHGAILPANARLRPAIQTLLHALGALPLDQQPVPNTVAADTESPDRTALPGSAHQLEIQNALQAILADLQKLHATIEDHLFSHQADAYARHPADV